MDWTALKFGKYKGKTLPEIIFTDPDWFFWAYEESKFMGRQIMEAEEIYRKATSIKIPQQKDDDIVVEYFIQSSTHSFVNFELVPRSRPAHMGTNWAFRKDVIDLSVPKQFSRYDKWGGKRIIKLLKLHLFGSTSYRMTKQRCEDFFNDDKKCL